jgi:hypothetical protein
MIFLAGSMPWLVRGTVAEVAPGDAGAVGIEDGVHQGAQVVDGFADAVAGLAPGFEGGADEFPAGVGQVAGVGP